MFWEHQGNCAIRKGKWKALKTIDESTWKLFDISKDRIESHDVANQHPALAKELDEKWNAWAYDKKVLPKKIAGGE